MNTNKKVATFLVSLPYHELKFLAIAFLNLAQTRNIFFPLALAPSTLD